jgi:hypothetical protein
MGADVVSDLARLQKHFPGVLRMTLTGTVRAFESVTLAQSLQGFFRNDMATGHHHGWVFISRLLLRYWADKD